MNTVQIRDEKQVYQTVQQPAILYDKRNLVLLKIGEKDRILERYEKNEKALYSVGIRRYSL